MAILSGEWLVSKHGLHKPSIMLTDQYCKWQLYDPVLLYSNNGCYYMYTFKQDENQMVIMTYIMYAVVSAFFMFLQHMRSI